MANLKTSLELDIKPFIDAINRAANSLKKIDDVNVKFNRSEFAKLEAALKRIPTVKNITTNVLGEAEAIRDLNQVEKNVKQIPNSKNINVNVDKNSSNRISQQLGGLTNQTSKLGTGLTGAFGGAAVGAAVAAFAYKAGRALLDAGKTADEIGDKLDLAFSQAGFSGEELKIQVKGAQDFSSKLAKDFGVSAIKTQEILSKVVSLTGITGNSAQEITKAVIGIEKASDGAITAQKAITFFTKSLGGDPESLAALETLKNKFPALASAIESSATAGQKAILINQQLAGTFEALARDADTTFSKFDRAGEALTLAIGKGVNDSLDLFAPLFDVFSKGFGGQEGAPSIIESIFGAIDSDFIEPLVKIIEDLATQFQNLNTQGTATIGAFTLFKVASDLLLGIIEALGEVTLAIVEIFNMFSGELELLSKLLILLAKSAIIGFLQLLKGVLEFVVDVFKALRVTIDTVNLSYKFLADSTQILSNLFQDLAKDIDNALGITEKFNSTLEYLSELGKTIADAFNNFFTPAVNKSDNEIGLISESVNVLNGALNSFIGFSKGIGKAFSDIGIGALNAIPGIQKVIASFDKIGEAYDRFKNTISGVVTAVKEGPAIDDLGSALRDRRGSTGIPDTSALALERIKTTITKPLGTGGGGKTPTETALEKQLKAFKEITDFIDGVYSTGLKKINLLEQERNANSLIGLTALEKLETKRLEFVAAGIKQEEIQTAFAKSFNLTTDEQINGLLDIRKTYLKLTETVGTYNDTAEGSETILQNLAIKILPPKTSAEDVKKFIETYRKIIDDNLQAEIAEASYDIELRDLNIKFSKESLNNSLDSALSGINSELSNIAIGIPATVGQDAFKELLNKVIKDSEAFTGKYNDVIIDLSKKIDKANLELVIATTKLPTATGDGKRELEIQIEGLGRQLQSYKASIIEVTNEQRDSENTTNKATEALNKIEEGYLNAALAAEEFKFRTVDAFLKVANAQLDKDLFKFEANLNVDGVSQGLIAIQKDFFKASKEIEISTQAFIKRLEIEAGGTTDAATVAQTQAAITGVTKASEEQLKTLKIQRDIAIREFKIQNDVIFAINEALANNLASVIAPDTTGAKSNLDKKKKEIDSEVELLKAKLEIENQLNADNLEGRSLSYQEYTEKILDLEKEKNDAIKTFDDEVNAKRLEGLQKIATESLPAINNQLIQSQAELSETLRSGAAGFEELAAKSLEVIGIVAVQSLAIAIQQAKTMEEIQKLFLKNVVAGIIKVLQAQLIATLLEIVFKEVKEKSFLGFATAAIIGGAVTGLFAIAQAKLNSAIDGFSEGGYTGNANTNAVAGVVHGQEFVINADGTKRNRAALEYANNGGNLKDFFKGSGPEINTFVDTKNMSNSITGLANAMDSRLSSLETTVDRAIRQSSTTMKSQNSVDVSVYSDPGTTIKYMKKMGKIKGLS